VGVRGARWRWYVRSMPSITRLHLADEIMAVSDEDAVSTARRLARMEGVFGGTSFSFSGYVVVFRQGLAVILGEGDIYHEKIL